MKSLFIALLLSAISTTFLHSAIKPDYSRSWFIGGNASLSHASVHNSTIFNHKSWEVSSSSHFSPSIDIFHMFTNYFGLGTGVSKAHYSTLLEARFMRTILTNHETDKDGDIYIPNFRITNFSDQMLINSINIPVYIKWKAYAFNIDMGLVYSGIYESNFNTNGLVTTTGYYPDYQVTLADIPEYGFGVVDYKSHLAKMDTPSAYISGFASAGFLFALHSNFFLKINAKYAMGLTDLGYNTSQHAHDFYRLMQLSGDKTKLISYGLDLGLYFRL